MEEVDYTGAQSLCNNILPTIEIFKVNGKYELYSHLSISKKEELQRIHGKKISWLEHQPKDHTTQSRRESHDSEVSDIKLSLFQLHD